MYFVVGLTSKDSHRVVNSAVCIRGYCCETHVHVVYVQVLILSAPKSTRKVVR